MLIKAISRRDMQMGFGLEGLKVFDQYKIISINCSSDYPLFGSLVNENLLTLHFDDIERFIPSHPTLVMFDEVLAAKVVEFIKKLDPDKDNLLVHCHAGISRSGAVVTFAREYFKTDYDRFLKDNPYICPNLYVLKMLRKVAC